MFNHKVLFQRGFLCCLLLIGLDCFASSKGEPLSKAKVVASWSFPNPLHSTRWSPTGRRILVVTKQGKEAVVSMLSLKTKKKRLWHRFDYGFFPDFGPVGTVFSGPLQDPPAVAKGVLSKKMRSKLPHKGVFLLSRKTRSFLYPGWYPRYSPEARRLAFQYRGLLYLWNPLPRQKGKDLFLLSKGSSPCWAPNGRAIAFLHRPFKMTPKGHVSGGGIRIMDMLFRGAKVTDTGGQVTWSPTSLSMAYVDKWKGEKEVGVFTIRLKGKKIKRIPLVKGGSFPSWAPVTTFTKNLLAYQDRRGVWLIHLKTRKKQLVAASGFSKPSWSAEGNLLVSRKHRVTVLQVRPVLYRSLSK